MAGNEGGTFISDLRREVMSASVASPVDGAVFYSGTSRLKAWNQDRALAYVRAQPPGRATVFDLTPSGQRLSAAPFKPTPELATSEAHAALYRIGMSASERFAKEASGRTTCFVDGAKSTGTFRKTELPALLANGNVTHVNGIPRDELKREFDLNRTQAFRRIEGRSRELQPQTVGFMQPGRAEPAPIRRPLSRSAAGQPPVRSDDRARGRSR